MKNTLASLSCCTLILFAASCKKSQNSAPANALSGNYKLVNIHAHTYSSADENAGGIDDQTITVSDYTSIDNSGGLDITGNTMSTVNMAYGVSTTLEGAEFIDGVFQDSLSFPFDVTIPASSNTSSYKLIGTDSLYFPSGFISSPNGGAPVKTIAVGAKFLLSGSTLTMTIIVPPQISTQSTGGATITSTESATETITLQKQ